MKSTTIIVILGVVLVIAIVAIAIREIQHVSSPAPKVALDPERKVATLRVGATTIEYPYPDPGERIYQGFFYEGKAYILLLTPYPTSWDPPINPGEILVSSEEEIEVPLQKGLTNIYIK